MARTGLTEINELPDVLQGWNFDLVIANVPGGGDGRSLMVKCQTTAIPGVVIEPVLVGLHGAEVQFAGRQVYSHNFTATFIESVDISTRQALLGWSDFCRNTRDNTGRPKSEYSTTVDLVLYNDAGETVRTIRLFGAFILNLEEGALDGASSTPVILTASFSYDFFNDV